MLKIICFITQNVILAIAMKHIFSFLLVTFCTISFAQVISPNNPYTKDFVELKVPAKGSQPQTQTQSSKSVKLDEITQAFDAFWKGKDYRQKGSGYKPFKRWAENWSDYLQPDGTIAPPSVLWGAWRQKTQNESKISTQNVPTANWTNLGPAVVTNSSVSISGQGRVNAIAKDPSNPNTIYVGAPAGGIWRSTDDGVNWTPLSDYLPQIGVSGIAVDPNNPNIIYISTGDDDAADSYSIGVLKTLDGGQTWNNTGLQFNNLSQGSSEIFIDPTDSNTVWVATLQGLYKTTDGGDNWLNIVPGNIVDFRFQPGNSNTLFVVGYDNANNSKFYKVTDGGNTVTEISTIPNNSNRIILEVTPANPNMVYVLSAYDNGDGSWQGANSFQGVYKSTDAGDTFIRTAENDDIFRSSQSWYDMALTVSDTDPNIVFVGVLDIWKSENGGDDFFQINSWSSRTAAFTHADIHFMRYFDGVLYAGTDGGIYRSYSDGNAFEDLSNTLSIAQLYTVSTSRPDSGKLAGGLQDCGGFALSGSQWNSYHGGDGMGSAVDPFQEDWYYGMTQYGGNLYRTRVGGSGGWDNREYIASGPTQGNWVTPMQFNKNGELYAGYDQLYVLQSGSWQKVSNHNFGENLRQIELDPNNSNTIYVSTNYNVYKSTNKGQTFSMIYSSGTGYIRSIEVHHTNSDKVWILTKSSLEKSNDGGVSFSNMGDGMPAENHTVLKHHPYSDHDALYLGTLLGVYYYDDLEANWTSISQGLPNVKVSDIEINVNDHTLTASTYGRGVWQTPIPEVSLPDLDVDLLSIDVGISDYDCNGQVLPSLRVFNNGTQNITDFVVETQLNGTSLQDQNWSGTITPGQWTEIYLDNLEGQLTNTNVLSTTLVLSGDNQTQNNRLEVGFNYDTSVVNQSSTTNTLFSYEAADEDWLVVGNPIWEKGTPNGSYLNQTASGTVAYATNLNGNYPQSSTSELVSPCFDLSLIGDPVVKFYMEYDLETGWDYLYFQYSTDGGKNWVSLNQFTGRDNTPDDASLSEYIYNLGAITNESSVIFRFRLVSDYIYTYEGAVIDDFVIEGVGLYDTDGDGVTDDRDVCPNTAPMTPVDSNGCLFTLPKENYGTEITSGSCADADTGSAILSVTNTDYTYNVSIDGRTFTLSESEGFYQSVDQLGIGDYTACFTIEEVPYYQECVALTIAAPETLSATYSLDEINGSLALNMEGASLYYITNTHQGAQTSSVSVNGKANVTLNKGINLIEVSTDLDCQGSLQYEFFISEEVLFYPNPTKGEVFLYVGGSDNQVECRVRDIRGNLIEQVTKSVSQPRNVSMDLSNYARGIYFVEVSSPTVRQTLKVVKQ